MRTVYGYLNKAWLVLENDELHRTAMNMGTHEIIITVEFAIIEND